MRHPTPTRRARTLLVAAAAALLTVVGLTAPASALLGGATPAAVPAAVPAAATSGCGRPAALASGSHTVSVGGTARTFRLDVPDGYDPNRAYRLVVGLHWWHGTSADVVNQRFYGLEPLAGTSTVFVAPQGIDNAWPNTNGQDVAFIDAVLRVVESGLCIDTTQRFATGFSYGGGMSNALACARADVFRAVAVLNGAQLSGCAGGTQPIAYLGSHGVVDDVLAISQGRALRDRALRTNGCQPQQAPEPAAGSGTHVRTAYTCRDGFPVVWIASDSGHQWDARDRGQQQSWVPGEVWRFFTSLPSTTPTPTPTPTVTPTPPPTPTPTPTPTVTPTPTTSPGGCTATYRTVNAWPGGFQGEVTVRAGAPTTAWSVSWRPAGERVDQVWNGSVSTQGGAVVVTNVEWNGRLATGGTATFGLLGSGTAPTPTLSCTAS
ncbi:cellulose binding domain-containing protein [Cellulomonas fimi]|uniref:Cellulose-binding family II n=1 Tax=Cellulomonas fimi (strain ATCC 484 / DSM 20113 / JCM 1341 / CCUG 24087 / LMG 16345 / NBRC 15513 / NCIMB 8980 / NCTC 7547 / NRS-133) TaxID=590998 RepID=F4H7J0_CELFA|nr:cellulose binding domain-containing protein [Cellulomonas fimi]AEE44547.1 cellulose-binding family II [Cellulomonas fimi ATCC 484]NNH06477.1 cellulose-binding protein [Cellulomonas fimi]VEH26585.1 Endoglucanase A precursor [Cellulomonas fimi]